MKAVPVVLVPLLLVALLAGALASDELPIDVQRGKQLMRKFPAGETLTPEEQAYPERVKQEIREILVDTLPAIGEYAVQAGTRALLEPLNRNEAFFLRQVADGAAICRDCNNPGICLMADFYHMAIEETSCMTSFPGLLSRFQFIAAAGLEPHFLPEGRIRERLSAAPQRLSALVEHRPVQGQLGLGTMFPTPHKVSHRTSLSGWT